MPRVSRRFRKTWTGTESPTPAKKTKTEVLPFRGKSPPASNAELARLKFETVNRFSVLETWDDDSNTRSDEDLNSEIETTSYIIRAQLEMKNVRKRKSRRKANVPVEIDDSQCVKSVLDDFFDSKQKSANRWLGNLDHRSGKKRSGICWPRIGKKFTETYRSIYDALRKNIAFRRNKIMQFARRQKLKQIRRNLWKGKLPNLAVKNFLISNVFQLGGAIPHFVLKYLAFIGDNLFQVRALPNNRAANWLLRRSGAVNSTLTSIELLDKLAFRQWH